MLKVYFANVPGLGSGSYSWTELYGGTCGTGTGGSATLSSHDMVGPESFSMIETCC